MKKVVTILSVLLISFAVFASTNSVTSLKIGGFGSSGFPGQGCGDFPTNGTRSEAILAAYTDLYNVAKTNNCVSVTDVGIDEDETSCYIANDCQVDYKLCQAIVRGTCNK